MIPRCFLKVLILLILFPPIVFAEDFKTVDGKEYKNATVSRVEPDGIVIKFSRGIVKIPFTALSQDLQKEYHYDPGAAASYAAADVAAQQRFAQEQAEQQQRAAAEDAARNRAEIKKNAHTLREVRSDQLSFLDKPFLIEGKIELGSYYNWGYRDTEPTHYSFELSTPDGRCYAYMERAKAAALRQRLVDSGGALKGLFSVVILSSRYQQDSGEPLLELLDYVTPR
jgi:hypothetical protein